MTAKQTAVKKYVVTLLSGVLRTNYPEVSDL